MLLNLLSKPRSSRTFLKSNLFRFTSTTKDPIGSFVDLLLPANTKLDSSGRPEKSIINDIDTTLSNRYIKAPEFDADVKELLTANLNPDSRDKPLWVTVAGMGQGKTRTLVETQEILQKSPGVMPVAITFNDDSGYSIDDEKFTPNTHFNYASSLIARMMFASIEGISFDRCRRMIITAVKKRFETIDPDERDLAVSILQEFVRQLVALKSAQSPKEISTFVLLMDETMKIQEKLNKEGIHEVVRSALLDKQLRPESPLNVQLVMTGLYHNMTGKTKSGRSIRILHHPEHFDPSEVVEDWWLPQLSKGLQHALKKDPISLKRLQLFAAMSNRVPRVLERTCSALKALDPNLTSAPSKQPSSSPIYTPGSPTPQLSTWSPTLVMSYSPDSTLPIINAALVREIYGKIRKAFLDKYPLDSEVTLEQLDVLLHGTKLLLDDAVMDLIANGIFTNHLKEFPDHKTSVSIVPSTSMVVMDALSSKFLSSTINDSQVSFALIAIYQEMQNTVTKSLNYLSKQETPGALLDLSKQEALGALLEHLSTSMIKMRVITKFGLYESSASKSAKAFPVGRVSRFLKAFPVGRVSRFLKGRFASRISTIEPPKNIISFQTLFCIPFMSDFSVPYIPTIGSKVASINLRPYTHHMKIDSHDDKTTLDFFKELASISSHYPVFIHPHARECFDFAFYVPGLGFFAIEAKSSLRAASPEPTIIDVVEEFPRGNQNEHFLGLVEKLKQEMKNNTITPTPLIQSLIDGDFLYIYLNPGLKLDFRKGHVVNLGKESTDRFLGLYSDFYNAARYAKRKDQFQN